MRKILLDTCILLWVGTDKLPPKAIPYIDDETNILLFSPISIMEIVIKSRQRRPDFIVNPSFFYSELLRFGYEELLVTSRHALTVETLPLLHKDPLDRILVAQALSEGISFLTSDKTLANYPGSIIYVG